MPEAISKFLEIIRESTKHLFTVSIACIVLLFSPQQFLEALGVATYCSEYRTQIGVSFIISLVIILSRLLWNVLGIIKTKILNFFTIRKLKKRFLNLTPQEKAILKLYIDGQTRTQYFHLHNGIIAGLESDKILYRATSVSAGGTAFPYNIQSWAYDFLRKNTSALDL